MSMLALFNASSPMYGFSVPKASECSSTATFNRCFASSPSTSLRFSSSAALMLKYCVLRAPPPPPQFLDVAADLGDMLEAGLAVQVDADDVVPRLRERPRRSFTEPAGRPENQRPF